MAASGRRQASETIQAVHGAPAALGATDTALDDMLAPLERTVKSYLTDTLAATLIELLAVCAIERPADPHLWLAQRLLEKSPDPNGYMIKRKGGGGGKASDVV
jgi:hypothetical protein